MLMQVETIGDLYMMVAGLTGTAKNHAEAVTNMAFGMRKVTTGIKSSHACGFHDIEVRL